MPEADIVPLPDDADPVLVVALDTDGVGVLTDRFSSTVDDPADPVFGVPAAAARALGSGGRLVNLGGLAGETSPITPPVPRVKSLRIMGYPDNALTAEQRAEAIAVVAGRVADGTLTVAHDKVKPANAPGAWSRCAAGETDLRTVVVPYA